jgi:hypothetical protein
MHADMAELASWAFVQICIKSTQHMKKGKKVKKGKQKGQQVISMVHLQKIESFHCPPCNRL